jgi:hypothetical protein
VGVVVELATRTKVELELPVLGPSKRPETLNEKTWKLLAIKHYDNTQACGIEEFEEDLKRFKYIKKMITRYKTNGELCERLILNHIVTLVNVFGPEFTARLLFFKIREHFDILKPFLITLGILPPIILSVGKDGRDWHTDDMPMDPKIIAALRRI